MAKVKLPKEIFVAWRTGAGSDPWLTASETEDEAIEDDGPDYVGTYKLVKIRKLAKRVSEVK